jgi:hypothetical protein
MACKEFGLNSYNGKYPSSSSSLLAHVLCIASEIGALGSYGFFKRKYIASLQLLASSATIT